ncbi:MAG: ribonuclease H-like domain-containing protein, partial [Gelidibacter sp.]|nr:ribonuclease H-like domain-containing protein [Gelidibacter sp.]
MPKSKAQEILAKEFGVTTRTIRRIAKEMGLNVVYSNVKEDKIMVYDIETSRVNAKVFWTGKQYINHSKLTTEAKIISIAWKWVGADKVHSLTWDKDHCDKKMLTKFLKEYNKASMVIGQNNDNFDNKWINTRAAKHRLHVSRFVKSYDIYKMAKKYFRLPSFSMAYMAKYFGLTLKQSHEGLFMWDMIEDGDDSQQKEYLQKMVNYNIGDIVTTEELYLTLKTYFGTVTNKAVSLGLPKWCCPVSGSDNVKLLKTIFTEQGTVQRILFCEDSRH